MRLHNNAQELQTHVAEEPEKTRPIVKNKSDALLINDDYSQIYVTSDLSRFAPMEGGNRPIDMNFIQKKLLPSIQENGFDKLQAIIVYLDNQKLIIVDGQHRLTACRLAKSAISYRLIPQEKVSDFLKKANCTKDWSTDNWLNYYADHKSPGYKEAYGDLKKMAIDANMSINTLIATCRSICKKDKRLSEYFNGKVHDIIYKGLFVFPVGMKEELHRQLKLFKELKTFLPKEIKESELCNKALVQVIFHQNYSHRKMIQALEKRVGDLKPASRLDRYREQVVQMYNMYQTKNNQIDPKSF